MVDTEQSDQALWEGIRRGDEWAFTYTFDRYHATLYNYGRKLCDDSALVEDAVQDVFIDVWRLRRNLTPNITSIKFYLYRSLRRRIHQGVTKSIRTTELSALSREEMPFIHDNSERQLVQQETSMLLSRRLQGLLAQLPARQVEAITLRYFDEFSFTQTAQIMGVSEKSVRNFIYRALVSLRQSRELILVSAPVLLAFGFF